MIPSEDEGPGELGVVRIFRLNKLSKLFRMMKLVRVVKFFKNTKYIHNISKSVMKTSIATERLVFFVLVLILGFHLCNCMWLWVALFFYDSFD